MKFDNETLIGVMIMIIGSYFTADGLILGKLGYTVVGMVFCGFSVLLWIEGIGRGLRDEIIEEINGCEDLEDDEEDGEEIKDAN